MVDPDDIQQLIENLKAREWDIASDAAKKLGEIGDPRALDALIEALDHDAPEVEKNAATALGEIGDKRAVDSLIQTLQAKRLLAWADDLRKRAQEQGWWGVAAVA